MKKIVSICLTVGLVLALSVTAYAAASAVPALGQQKECFAEADNDGVCDNRAVCKAEGTCPVNGCDRTGECQENKCSTDTDSNGVCDNRRTSENPGQSRHGSCGPERGCGRHGRK